MKNILTVIFLVGVLGLIPINTQAQCKSFANKICKAKLNPYVHDGNYHAAILTVGEEAELYKTFYSGQEYRIAICGSDLMPPIEFRVYDSKQNLIYTNKDNDYSQIWDFKLESSQQLKVWVKVVEQENQPDALNGCVAIMFGFKNK